jgi:hypothetical protein
LEVGIRRSEEKWLWEFEKWLVKNETSTKGSGEVESVREPLLGVELTCGILRFPWMKLGILVMIWFSFSFLYLLRGNRYGEL